RVCEIWQDCTEASAGPWLFDKFSAADIMFAPIATRFQTYNVQLSGRAKEYHHRILKHPLVEEWLALGMREKTVIKQFEDNM
ncbi:MAG: glutathione S-transferase, partial [Gammaproteobacteria bacterium]|nr:glutathione S-transferase [Gammaproteobacteria bacterium]